MAKYNDTGSGNSESYLGHWMDQNVLSGIRGFRLQAGYFDYDAVAPFAPYIARAAIDGFPVCIVLGSSRGSLTKYSLEKCLALLQGASSARLTVVSFSNAVFHPKVVHVVRPDSSEAAVVGSGNFTKPGMGANVEASIQLDTDLGDPLELLGEVATSIDSWADKSEADGAFQIGHQDDIDRLAVAQLIDVPQPRASSVASRGAGARDPQIRPVARTILWRPSVGGRRRAVRRSTRRGRARVGAPERAIAPSSPPAVTARWFKKMPSSDAQWVTGKTNPTGKLRLSKATHAIDHKTWFRRRFFRSVRWWQEIREHLGEEKAYEVAEVSFHVVIRDQDMGEITLRVDHAKHRVAAQDNVPTVLAWGHEMGRFLAAESHVGDWVVMERTADDSYSLTVQRERPEEPFLDS